MNKVFIHRDEFLKVYGVEAKDWADKYGIKLFSPLCPVCNRQLVLTVPIRSKGFAGLMAEKCVCSTENRPYCYVEVNA